jgi:nucleotide-binding universal stress UspA family protein
MIRTLFGRPHAADNPLEVSNVLVASEGRRFSQEVIDLAVRLVHGQGGRAQVLTVARLWGTSFGLPNPGLRPSRREMAEQEENIIWAIARLESAGVEADGHIVTTRNPCRSILSEARRKQCDAIVMGADPRRNWLVRSMMWSQEPYRVRGRTEVPVHLVCPAGQH